ncbi:hypothetical protein [Methanocella conradii]|nr:hypothetical protein [Methanocella conradii]
MDGTATAAQTKAWSGRGWIQDATFIETNTGRKRMSMEKRKKRRASP